MEICALHAAIDRLRDRLSLGVLLWELKRKKWL